MIAAEHMAELTAMCGEAREMTESGQSFIYLSQFKLPAGCEPAQLEALLCPHARDGYTTRLFLSAPVAGRGQNWTIHRIVDRSWYTFSWNNVSAQLRPAEILAEHLRALR